ncbi:23S rRNA (guanosine-2'-O-)-methyltransferase RlmB [Candidatus Terasakiella magnetica]|uniref:23S rRNA (Guanosine-2'-O-)-methyltransferase RlmB n=1 Tax=Candidatus Terasakiella magnetica TaxID=1867952 RepID=A0A1C3RDH7_9PROT|nr:23S rRNA (guanosine(2251)-2'-O)-methyltransferase RlmB [Candidatus Terasakiella magnetica]SCA55319.1 23S rRNA (guanosine-2'-O-)-methyltransferase RlmB [Candidatus Terasakiella magnetica]
MSKQNKRRPNQHKRKAAPQGKRHDGIAKHSTEKNYSDKPKGPPWLYGRHAVIAALQNPKRNCHQLVVSEEFIKSHGSELDEALNATERHRPAPQVLDRREIEDLCRGGVHQGIALQLDPLPRQNLEDILEELADTPNALVVALDQATDPQNIGAVLRSAAAFGASCVMIPEKNAPEVTPAMAKAACGALERIPFLRITNLSRSLDQLKEEGFWSVGLDGYAETMLSTVDMKGKTVLVMGSEGSGLRRLTKEKCDFLAKIPISQAVESLNLSNATAVALYEIARQRG